MRAAKRRCGAPLGCGGVFLFGFFVWVLLGNGRCGLLDSFGSFFLEFFWSLVSRCGVVFGEVLG